MDVDRASSPRVDVAIVGAGVVGVASAYYLARAGCSVAVIDGNTEVGSGCSYGNAGLVSPSHCVPLARPQTARRLPRWLLSGDGPVSIRLRASRGLFGFGARFLRSCTRRKMLTGLRVLRDITRESKQAFEELSSDEMLRFDYRSEGLMNVCRTQAAFHELRREAELLAAEGFEPEILGKDEARAREPALSEEITGGVFWAEDAHCDPTTFARALAESAAEQGVEFVLGEEVVGFDQAPSGRIVAVETRSSRIKADKVVLAAGAWSAKLARRLGLRVPIEPGKGYHVEVPTSEPVVGFPLIFQELVFAATPLPGRLRLAGTMDFVGFDAAVTGRADRLLQAARPYIHGLGEARVTSWAGLRAMTPDSLPIIGYSSRVDNLILATGHGMLGLTLAPFTGKQVARSVRNGGDQASLAALTPARFGI